MPPPRSTTGRYIPGVGLTLTRANIAWALRTRLIEPTDSPDTIALKFQPRYQFPTDHYVPPSKRHVGRAYRLVSKGATESAA